MRLHLPLLLLPFLLVPSLATAQNKVLISCSNGSVNCELNFDAAIEVWEDAGAQVEIVHQFSAAFLGQITNGDIRLIVVASPVFELNYESPTTSLPDFLPGFLAGGGRVVFLAEQETSEFDFSNAIIRDELDKLPFHGLSLNLDEGLNAGCNNYETDLFGTHALTEGLQSWHFASVNTVGGGTPLIRFSRSDDSSQATLAAVGTSNGGDVVLVADRDGFATDCFDETAETLSQGWIDDQAAFWLNLYGDIPAVDADNDGFSPPEDCDDTDQFVFPGAEEFCDNGVDDDCDGDVDGDDDECEDTPDDDDDATAGDDDDDDDATADDDDLALPDDDDSYTPDTGEWSSGCCGSSQAGQGGGGLGVLLLLGLVAIRRR